MRDRLAEKNNEINDLKNEQKLMTMAKDLEFQRQKD